MLWRTLNSDGMAPPSFGQILMRAWEYYSAVMLADKAFDFLLLCDNGEWKLREWSTRSYPSWYHNRLAKDIDDGMESGESFLLSMLATTFIRSTFRLNPQLCPSKQQHRNRRLSHRKQQQRRQCHRHRQRQQK